MKGDSFRLDQVLIQFKLAQKLNPRFRNAEKLEIVNGVSLNPEYWVELEAGHFL
jgi:hypothetical protein